MDFPSLFGTYRDRADLMASCANTVVLRDAAGDPLPDQDDLPAGSQIYIELTEGRTNVLRLTGEQLDDIAGLTFRNQPSADTPLLIDVDTTGTDGEFVWHTPNMAGVSGANAPYILWNFADATDITIADGDSVEGTVFAPRADLTDLDPANLEGDVIVHSLVAGPLAGEPGGPANAGEIHYFPFDADLRCDTGTDPTPTPSDPTSSPTDPTPTPSDPTSDPTDPTPSPTDPTPTTGPTDPTPTPSPTDSTPAPPRPTASPTPSPSDPGHGDGYGDD